MNATLHAGIVKGKPRVVLAFDPGDITMATIGGTIIETMFRLVGPVKMEKSPRGSLLVFDTCTAKWAAMSRNGAAVVIIEFETPPPIGSDLALMLAQPTGPGN